MNIFCKYISWSRESAGDKWSAVRDWFTEFNKRRIATVQPSSRLTVDESMSMNRINRTEKNRVPGGLPHQTKIARKPEGVGVQIRTSNRRVNQNVILLHKPTNQSKKLRYMKLRFYCCLGAATTGADARRGSTRRQQHAQKQSK
jgi:hypothetical protein